MARTKPVGWKGQWPPDREGKKYKTAKVNKEVEKDDEEWVEDELIEYESSKDEEC